MAGRGIVLLLCCLPALAAASRSAGPPALDSAMLSASERYAGTLGLLAPDTTTALLARAPSREEAALFLQAEACFLYRPGIRGASALSLAGTALAAVTDFAPLGEWSASADEDGLRLLANDGAVRLFELFLARYPDSPLTPFVLYRLAWAYRGVSTPLFPRSPDSCERELQARFPASPFAAWAGDARQVPYKLQGTAVAWSIFPGAGQIYVGKTASGLARLGVAVACTAAALVPPVFMFRDRRISWPGLALSAAGFIGLQISYTLAFQDAQRGALSFNERREGRFRAAHPGSP